MKFTFDFDQDDWIAFQRDHFNLSPTYRRMRNIARIILPVFVLVIMVLTPRGQFTFVYYGILLAAAVAVHLVSALV